jgi:hypothetical protein
MMRPVRTTVTLDTDTEALLRKHMKQRGVSFKQALNDAIRAGLLGEASGRSARTKRPRFKTPTADLGLPTVVLDRALALAGELEDEEVVRKMRVGK